MKTTIISKLPINPEEFNSEVHDDFNWTDGVISHMLEGERKFVNGLVQYYEPEKILELGVAAGGGTINLLNAMLRLDNKESRKLYAVDLAIKYFDDPSKQTGWNVVECFEKELNKQWFLFLGKDPSCVLEEIGDGIDFCVIDTGHYHPVETLNFICTLPFLKDGAIVVLHDISLYGWHRPRLHGECFASRLLFSSVCAEKITSIAHGAGMKVPNIAAFQVGSDTRKYCRNLFESLYFPWEHDINDSIISTVRVIVEKYYDKEMLALFDEAVKMNKEMLAERVVPEISINKLPEDTIFYGAGNNMKKILLKLEDDNLEFKHQIWDANADEIKTIGTQKVLRPDLDTKAKKNQIMIVTISSEDVFTEVKNKFEKLGYIVVQCIDGALTIKFS